MVSLIEKTAGYYKALKKRLSESFGNEMQVSALEDIISSCQSSKSVEEFQGALEGGLQLELDRAMVIDKNRALAKAAEEFEETPQVEMYEGVVKSAKKAQNREELDRFVEDTMAEKEEKVKVDSRAKSLFVDLLHALKDWDNCRPGELYQKMKERAFIFVNELHNLGYDFKEILWIERFNELQPYDDELLRRIEKIYDNLLVEGE